MEQYATINEYIALQNADIQSVLQQIRNAIQEAAPQADECISYKMPAFYFSGKPLVYFAAHKRHIGFYPIPSGVIAFKTDLQKFRTTKGGIQFPYNQPLPLDLIVKIVEYRIEEIKCEIMLKDKKH